MYVATDVGVAASNDGKQWRAVHQCSRNISSIWNNSLLTETPVYGFIKDTGIYRLESGTWEQIVSEMPDHVEGSLAVDAKIPYTWVHAGSGNMLRFNLDK